MSEENRIVTNLEKFNDNVKRTSQRLSNRAGSAPLEDRPFTSGTTIETNKGTDTTNSARGAPSRGRGRTRGKKLTAVNTRASAAAQTLATEAAAAAAATASANTDTLTSDASANPTRNVVNPTNKENPALNTNPDEDLSNSIGDTSGPTGQIERDETTENLTSTQSPARQSTITRAVTVNTSGNVNSVTKCTSVPTAKPVQKNKNIGFVDLSNIDNAESDGAKNSRAAETTKGPEPTTADKDGKAEVDDKGIDSNGLVSLLDYFDKKMKGPKGYIPPSVFNTQWLKQDLIQQSFLTTCTLKMSLSVLVYTMSAITDLANQTPGRGLTPTNRFTMDQVAHPTPIGRIVEPVEEMFEVEVAGVDGTII
ncbi:uncharacterized protein MELLADRAFT_62997 [Melampsora larici-populina 98AG31]|uniref:Uncharacterized protein n=1 Tax=Melampsora larici-populina (strain 98AG31 / pathotype 3-4-7) TaxID=747676 RepID=F4RKW8_MELLP|nr:uncharacterized protein MELLADRAFT_62997 [Melampsora larici-populina 98AG31]EGG06799.1 hypothetical protein MELLADRAFT_62997 [Melampsora larici-populina 98AG31]